VSGSKVLVRAWRLSVFVLSVSFAPLLFGQVPPSRTQTKPAVNETRGVTRAQIGAVRLPPSTVPLLFGMKRVEVVRALAPLHLRPKFLGMRDGIALAQEPAAGTSVPYGSGVVVTLGEMPRLVLNGPAAPAYAGSELTFSVAFVPPLPAGPKVGYYFAWGDGSPTESTGNAVVTHRFADTGNRVVSVTGVIDGRFKIGSRVVVEILPPPTPTPPSDSAPTYVPLLFGMNRVQVSRVLEPLHLQPKFSGPDNGVAVEQKPPAGTRVRYGSAVGVTLGEMPQLVLNGPAAPAYAGSELTFSVSFVPPLPAGTKVDYYFAWGDGSPSEPSGSAVVTHRFADAGNRVVSVTGMIDGRFKIGSRVPVEILTPLPPTDTTPTATDTTTSATTPTVATEGSTATEPTTTTELTTSSATATTPTTTTAESTTTTASTTTAVPTPAPSSNLLVWIGAAAVVLLLVVTFLLARVLRALNRKPPEVHVQAKSPVAFNGGVQSIEYEIEHPELIRRGPAVGLRGGIRAEEGDDV
jgi:hypothetical protein